MSGIEKYRQYFTKDYLMGPNSFRLLDELIRRKPRTSGFTEHWIWDAALP